MKETRIAKFKSLMKCNPDMPETCGLEYLIEYLHRIGMVLNLGMGAVNLSFCEIDAWCRRTKIELSPFEGEAIYQLSRSYVAQLAISRDANCPAPYMPKSLRSKESVSEGILKVFEKAALKNKPKPKPKR